MTEKYNRRFEGIWIPASIWLTPHLTLQEKIFLVEINSLDNEDGCFASNDYFAQFFQLSKNRCSEVINKLKEKGLVTVNFIYKPGSKQVEKRIVRVNYNHQLFNPKGIRLSEGGIRKVEEGYSKSRQGYSENCEDNNTVNNTLVNSSSTENPILSDERLSTLTKFYDENIQRMTGYIHECIVHMMKENDPELVMEAFKIAAGRQPDHPLKYIEGTLEKWRNKSIKSLQDLQAKEAREKNASNQQQSISTTDDAEERLRRENERRQKLLQSQGNRMSNSS